MQIIGDVSALQASCVKKPPPNELSCLTRRKTEIVLEKKIECLNGVVLPSRANKHWKHVSLASKHSLSITFSYGI